VKKTGIRYNLCIANYYWNGRCHPLYIRLEYGISHYKINKRWSASEGVFSIMRIDILIEIQFHIVRSWLTPIGADRPTSTTTPGIRRTLLFYILQLIDALWSFSISCILGYMVASWGGWTLNGLRWLSDVEWNSWNFLKFDTGYRDPKILLSRVYNTGPFQYRPLSIRVKRTLLSR
jgi:hypothetical protein